MENKDILVDNILRPARLDKTRPDPALCYSPFPQKITRHIVNALLFSLPLALHPLGLTRTHHIPMSSCLISSI